MGVREFLERLRNKRSKYKEFEEEQKIQEKFLERKKSANERELERFIKEQREENIKVELEKFRKRKDAEMQYGHQILGVKNMFDGEDNSVLGTPNVFTRNTHSNQGGNLFFKF